MKTNNNTCKILVIVTFIIMVTVNALANILPINGMGTGEISDSFPNLFAPSGLTFSIWGLIYILLALFAVYQTGLFSKDKTTINSEWLRKVGFLFVLSSMANTVWIFAWHYKIIELSLIMMLVILGSLLSISLIIKRQRLSKAEYFFIKIPFGVYFGWITVATIANITTQLVDWGWNGFGLSDQLWTIIVLIAGIVIGVSTVISNRDWAYGLVLIWAYAGILIKHLSQTGFGGAYTGVIITVIAAIALFAIASLVPIFAKKKE